jgi:drug/metabolite transporter (DMT)-like permease
MSHSQRLSSEGILLLLGLTIGWGINWPIMKFIIHDVPPLTFRGFCLFFGGLGILCLARASGLSLRIPAAFWAKILWICALNIVVWNVLATYGLSLLPAGRSALLGYTMPIWTVLLSVWVLHETFTWRTGIALLLGIAGVLTMMQESLRHWFSTELSMQLIAGAALMIVAAWGWAAGTVLMKLWQLPINTVVLTGWLLLLASLPISFAALLVDGIPQQLPSALACWGIIYNVFFAFMFCYWAWVRLVTLVPVSVSSLSSLATPLIGVLSGILLLGEQPGWPEYAATLLILGAVAVINIKRAHPITPEPAKSASPQ